MLYEKSLNLQIIRAAFQDNYVLDVVSQITGVPMRLIQATIKPKGQVDGEDLYDLKAVMKFFMSAKGKRLLRKLRQNQLEIYRSCAVTFRDKDGFLRQENGCFVEIRGKWAEVTLPNGHRFSNLIESQDFNFKGIRV